MKPLQSKMFNKQKCEACKKKADIAVETNTHVHWLCLKCWDKGQTKD